MVHAFGSVALLATVCACGVTPPAQSTRSLGPPASASTPPPVASSAAPAAIDAPRAALPVCSADGWCWQNPLPQGSRLLGVWGESARSVWAVGDAGAVLHFDGDSWRGEDSGSDRTLHAVSGSKDRVLVVGDSGTVLERRQGKWTAAKLDEKESLHGAWCAGDDDGWAVGARGTVYARVNGAWVKQNSGVTLELEAVWASGPTDVYVAGQRTLLRFDGRGFNSVGPGPKEIEGATFFDLWGRAADDVYAVGWDRKKRGQVIWHYDGKSWRSLEAGKMQMRSLHGIWGDTRGTWAVGTKLALGLGSGSFTEIAPAPIDLFDVWASDGHAIAVGAFGGIYSLRPGNDAPLVAQGRGAIQSIDSLAGDGSQVFAVGVGGVLLRRDDRGWSDAGSPTKARLRSVWARGERGIAVGDGGQALSFDGKTWVQGSTGQDQDLFAVAAHGDRAVAVGRKGTLLEKSGASWAVRTSGSEQDLLAVWLDASGVGFAVGKKGTIVRGSAGSWSPMAGGSEVMLSGVWGASPNDVYAVGDKGTILHYDGSNWRPVASGVDNELTAISGRADGELLVVGEKGVVLRRKPGETVFTRERSSVAGLLRACLLLQSGGSLIAGDYGAILAHR